MMRSHGCSTSDLFTNWWWKAHDINGMVCSRWQPVWDLQTKLVSWTFKFLTWLQKQIILNATENNSSTYPAPSLNNPWGNEVYDEMDHPLHYATY